MTIERFTYSIKASFVSDRELNDSELENLIEYINLQIQEPWDENQESENYVSSDILVELVRS